VTAQSGDKHLRGGCQHNQIEHNLDGHHEPRSLTARMDVTEPHGSECREGEVERIESRREPRELTRDPREPGMDEYEDRDRPEHDRDQVFDPVRVSDAGPLEVRGATFAYSRNRGRGCESRTPSTVMSARRVETAEIRV
jgi:hypothetical protein